MKKLLVCVLLAACAKEAPVHEQKPVPVTATRPSPPAPPPAQRFESASYPKAVEWIRSAPALHFDITIGDVKASGDLVRTHIGEERLRFRVNGIDWSAERRASGVTWTRNGAHETNEPQYADRIYQWLVTFPDPQKSPLQVVGEEAGETHVRFTILNTKETEDVWITRDNHIARLKTSGLGTAFPAVEMRIR